MEPTLDTTTIGGEPSDDRTIEPRLMDTTEIRRTDLAVAVPESAAEVDDPDDELDQDDDVDQDVGSARLIRPYAMTGGRTTAHADISLESQVQTSTRLNGDATTYRWEAAKILKLAERPMALVELAARAEIPIGVARVVISDLVDEGAVNVQRNVTVTSYTSLLEKVLDGIRDL